MLYKLTLFERLALDKLPARRRRWRPWHPGLHWVLTLFIGVVFGNFFIDYVDMLDKLVIVAASLGSYWVGALGGGAIPTRWRLRG